MADLVGLRSQLRATLGGSDNRDSGKSKDDTILEEARDRWTLCSDWEATARDHYLHDVKFSEGDSDNNYQWDKGLRDWRIDLKKPVLTFNKVRQHCLQIVNDARQNKAQIRIRPTGDKATKEASDVFEGIVRYIERNSNAMEAYDAATWHQVTGGWGYIGVRTEYIDDTSFDQDIIIGRVSDPLTRYLDPDIREFDGSDAKYGFEFEDMPRKAFDKKHPGWKDEHFDAAFDQITGWNDDEHVRVAKYFRIVEKDDPIIYLQADSPYAPLFQEAGLPVGETLRESDVRAKDPELLKALKDVPDIQRRTATKRTTEWYLIAGDKIVDRGIWPGSYIPIVRVIGEETVIEGRMDRKGHTRALLDAQRMFNWYASIAAEYAASQTNTPWLAPAAAIEGLETYWAEANIKTRAVLPYNHTNDDGESTIPPPQRIAPPVSLPAALDGMKLAEHQMMMASGQYQSQFGEAENAKSGVAIQTRQRQGDNATYHYIDHLAQALRFLGRILIDLIPKIYDTPRIKKIMADDGAESEVKIDPNAEKPHQLMIGDQPATDQQVKAAQADPEMADKVSVIFNPSIGKYAVEADIGPAFATRRQEQFAALSEMMTRNPKLTEIAGDLLFQSADFPMADQIAERLKRAVPPQLLGEGESPQVQQIKAQAKQLIDQAHAEIQRLAKDNAEAHAKLSSKEADHHLDDYKAETDRMTALAKLFPDLFRPVAEQLMQTALQTDIGPLAGVDPNTPLPSGMPPDGMIGGGPPTQPDQGMMPQ